jgi:hypothetical protein
MAMISVVFGKGFSVITSMFTRALRARLRLHATEVT